MLTKIHGLVISMIRHDERNNILTLYTAERGRMTLMSSASKSRNGRLRNARLAPMALIEADINIRENREIQFLGSFSTPAPWKNIYFDPVKAPIVIFLSEFLSKILRTSGSDLPTWKFLVSALAELDGMTEGIANYHIAFLIRFLEFAGIEPDPRNFCVGRIFDLRAGDFTDMHPGHRDVLTVEETALMPKLMRMNFENLHKFRFHVAQRRRLLRIIIDYYSLHLPVSPHLKSLEVLAEIF